MLLKERGFGMTIGMICMLYVCLYIYSIYTSVLVYKYICIYNHMCSINMNKHCQTERLKEREDVAQGKRIWNGYICLYLYIYAYIYAYMLFTC